MDSRKSFIFFAANQVLSNPEMMHRHMWKTQPCQFGVDCDRNISECAGVHFMEEYRVPFCLYAELCPNVQSGCKMYHPHLGTPQEYISFMGINKKFVSHDTWSLRQKRNLFHKNAHKMIADKDVLAKHFYKTKPCDNGEKCHRENCSFAHFSEEYRIPICLFLEFCEEQKCQNFHPNRETKEEYLKKNNITFKYSSEKEYKDTIPSPLESLKKANPLAMPSKSFRNKINTQFCSFVKEKGQCRKSGCTFAHSLEDLVVNFSYSSLEEKRKTLEKKTKIDDIFLRPSYMNSTYIRMMRQQVKMIDEMRAEENGEKYEEDEEEDEKNIEEILDEIEIEQHKQEFLDELEMFDVDDELEKLFRESEESEEEVEESEEEVEESEEEVENSEELVVKINVTRASQLGKYEKFSWADDSDEYYQGV